MDIGPGHWVFALVFMLAFIVLMIFAYRDDIKRSPYFFKGSWKIALIIVGSIMVLVVLKILFRISGYSL
jgi:cytochrome bd-type quinol oxidase subunit 1